MQEADVAKLYLDQIIDPKVLLRFVNKKSVAYLEMLDSIEKTGIWNSICVRPAVSKAADKFEVIDGFYRLTCCRELGWEPVPAIIRYGVTDDEVLAAQIRANAIRPETTIIEFAKQLKRIEKARPGITMRELAALVNKNPGWVGQQLGLLELDAKTQRMVERGDIPVQSAYMLAKIPRGLQGSLLDQARVMPTSEFQALAAAVIKRFMEQVRQGKLDKQFGDTPFEPQPYLRPLREILAEIKNRTNGPHAIVAANTKTLLEAFVLGLEWAAHLDRHSVNAQKLAAEGKSKKNLKRLYEERELDEDVNE